MQISHVTSHQSLPNKAQTSFKMIKANNIPTKKAIKYVTPLITAPTALAILGLSVKSDFSTKERNDKATLDTVLQKFNQPLENTVANTIKKDYVHTKHGSFYVFQDPKTNTITDIINPDIGETLFLEEFNYDKQGNLVQKIKKSIISKNTTEITNVYQNGALELTTTYDDDGNIRSLKETTYEIHSDNKVVVGSKTYNNKGQLEHSFFAEENYKYNKTWDKELQRYVINDTQDKDYLEPYDNNPNFIECDEKFPIE